MVRNVQRVTTSARRRLDGPWSQQISLRLRAPLTVGNWIALILFAGCSIGGLILLIWATGGA
jgi:hypothetical protein